MITGGTKTEINSLVEATITKTQQPNSAGAYIVQNSLSGGEKYIVLISGNSPFLKEEYIWDCVKNESTNFDVLRGKNLYCRKFNYNK